MTDHFNNLKEVFVKNVSRFRLMVLFPIIDKCAYCGMHFQYPRHGSMPKYMCLGHKIDLYDSWALCQAFSHHTCHAKGIFGMRSRLGYNIKVLHTKYDIWNACHGPCSKYRVSGHETCTYGLRVMHKPPSHHIGAREGIFTLQVGYGGNFKIFNATEDSLGPRHGLGLKFKF